MQIKQAAHAMKVKQAGGKVFIGGRAPNGEVLKAFTVFYEGPRKQRSANVYQAQPAAKISHEQLRELRYDEIKRLARSQGFSSVF